MITAMGDTIAGRLTPQTANAVALLGRNVLKSIDLSLRYGVPTPGHGKVLKLRA